MELPSGVDPAVVQRFLDYDYQTNHTQGGALGVTNAVTESEGEGLTAGVTAAMMMIGNWRVGPELHPQLAELAANIEATWWRLFPDDLRITTMDPRWCWLDTIDPNGRTAGVKWKDAHPEKGEPEWPRMVLENRCYETRVFRCLHMELAWRQDGFQVQRRTCC